MSKKTDLLRSTYIIDGIPTAVSPIQMLEGVSADAPEVPSGESFDVIADESLDPDPATLDPWEGAPDALLSLFPRRHSFPLPFAGPITSVKIAQALTEALFLGGHFRIGDLALKASWRWKEDSVGYAAAFFSSVESACSYLDSLGVKLRAYELLPGEPSLAFKTSLLEGDVFSSQEEDGFFPEVPYRTQSPKLLSRRKCPSTLRPSAQDWLIYIPFDPCDFRLGGSSLCEALGKSSPTAPDVSDSDYFIDCFEVVRELVEDSVVKAGAAVLDGGLLPALKSMTTDQTGASVCLDDICKAYGGEAPLRVAYSEVPGVIIQIADIDYDYVDAELLLQDVLFFPIGHPAPGQSGISFTDKTGLPEILESLLGSLEGED